MTERIQRKRIKGWRMPDNAVYVGRPTKWGNPISLRVAAEARPTGTYVDGLYWTPEQRQYAVDKYREWIGQLAVGDQIHAELAGRDLACWCPLDQPCHADVLLELANA